jgi:acetyl esterase/lipase
MTFLERLDAEFVDAVRGRPAPDFSDIAEARRLFWTGLEAARTGHTGVLVADHLVPRLDGSALKVRLFRPVSTSSGEELPLLYWVQGGGYILPAPDLDDAWCEDIVAVHSCAVASVEWRRAPEHPYPAAADDCYDGLSWLVRNSEELGLDRNRIVVGGASSGGGAAASVALRARDRGEFLLAHQLLIYPMLDNSNSTQSSYRITDPRVWNRTANVLAWRYYLGEVAGSESVSPYAAPARAMDLTGLAPATLLTGELDLFVDEDIAYAQRLMDSSVSTELRVYRGAPHGFYRMNPAARVTQEFRADCNRVLRYALA